MKAWIRVAFQCDADLFGADCGQRGEGSVCFHVGAVTDTQIFEASKQTMVMQPAQVALEAPGWRGIVKEDSYIALCPNHKHLPEEDEEDEVFDEGE